MGNKYNPKPKDLSSIKLPDSIDSIIEQIAENVHDVWAAQRVKEGWTYGKELNENIKEHPCLVPYEKLPESEKDYDRNTAITTLKLIQKMGYKIVQDNNK